MPYPKITVRTVRPALLTFLSAVALLLSFGSVAQASAKSRTAAAKPTVVLVHGAWANGSSWDGVVARLQRDGYTVDVPANPLRGVASDSAYLASYLKTVTGPIILAGHSYGGMVITNAATGNPAVKALVYIDAFIPAQGETLLQLAGAEPGSTLADPTTAFNFVPFTGPAGADTDLYVKPSVYRADFGADLSVQQDAILAATQEPLAASALQEPSGPPAWKTIPSYALIGTQDMVLPPAEQEFMAARAQATVVKINASHLGLISHPDTVARLIERAAVATG
ncbi:MAG: alpha/beta fold hydrolase [Solirubrobacteraceae bacterium]